MFMVVFLVVGERFAGRSFGPPSITGTIGLLGGELGVGRWKPPPCLAQFPLQLVDFTLHVSIVLCMGNTALPSTLAFSSMSYMHTSLLISSPFEAPTRITMLRPPWFCLVGICIQLVWTYRCLVWTCFFHLKRCTRNTFRINQVLPTNGANCRDWVWIGPNTGQDFSPTSPNNEFVERRWKN